MHLVLTDLLTCPRCGPGFGLILLANRIEERRVLDGLLGCANCREQYRVRNGAGDFGGPAALPSGEAPAEAVFRLGALLGVTSGPGFVLVAGPATAYARALTDLLEDIEVIAVPYGEPGPDRGEEVDGGNGSVSRLGVGARTRLPLATGKLPGVALTGAAAADLLEEGARVVSPVGRLVLDPAPPDAAARLAGAGMRVLAEEGATLVAVRG